ncbi:MAG: peptidylprolyl isomerase [Nitrospirae bacterium]|nr:peptidylprolyl isomerase [Nitrospirota bacterium]
MRNLFILLCIAIFSFGCTKGEDSGPAIAKVDGSAVTEKQFRDEYSRLPEWAKGRFQSKEGKKEFLNDLVKKELLFNKAQDMGLDKDKELKEKLEEFKKMWLITTLLKKEVEEKAKITDEKELKEFYDKNPQEFMGGAEVKASHILVATEAEAKDIYEKIKKGEDFAKLAKKFSKDQGSANRGGELGFFKRGMMVPEFEQAAFSLKPSDVSSPVKSRFGFHIIKVTDKKEGAKLEFEQVKEAIKRRITVEKQKVLFETFVEGLKKESKIDIDEKLLDSISLEAKPAAPPAK